MITAGFQPGALVFIAPITVGFEPAPGASNTMLSQLSKEITYWLDDFSHDHAEFITRWKVENKMH